MSLGGGGGGGLGRIRGGIGAVDEVPFTINNTFRFRGKKPEETTRKVETAVWTSGALVHDGGNSALSIVRDADLLEAVGTGVSVAVLLDGRGQITTFHWRQRRCPRGYSVRQ